MLSYIGFMVETIQIETGNKPITPYELNSLDSFLGFPTPQGLTNILLVANGGLFHDNKIVSSNKSYRFSLSQLLSSEEIIWNTKNRKELDIELLNEVSDGVYEEDEIDFLPSAEFIEFADGDYYFLLIERGDKWEIFCKNPDIYKMDIPEGSFNSKVKLEDVFCQDPKKEIKQINKIQNFINFISEHKKVTPLQKSILEGDNEIALGLIDKNSVEENEVILNVYPGLSAFLLATKLSNLEVMQKLVYSGVSPFVKSSDGKNAFWFVDPKRSDIFDFLVSQGIDPFEKNDEGISFIEGFSEKSLELRSYLCQKDWNDLHYAVVNNDLKIIQEICFQNSHLINQKNYLGNSPLNFAVRMGLIDVVRFFINQGANLKEKDNQGNNLVLVSLLASLDDFSAASSSMVDFLIDHNVSYDEENYNKVSAKSMAKRLSSAYRDGSKLLSQ